uniref:Sulfhydryl oxidase n=1 Tax=Faxonius propinquus nudivirus TaxID=3139431 RepID=A0AAU8GF13_9VIRU
MNYNKKNQRIIEEKNIQVYAYTFSKEEKFKQFIQILPMFLFYIKHYKPIYLSFINYRVSWIKFIINIFNDNNYEYNVKFFKNFTAITFMNTTYENLCYNLFIVPYEGSKYDGYKNIWGSRYWCFLHLISFLVYNNNEMLVTFACLLLNFHLVLLCSVCSENFLNKDPLRVLTMRIIKTQDSISTLYNFHNIVNETLLGTYSKYTEINFLKLYNCSRYIKVNSLSYIEIIDI